MFKSIAEIVDRAESEGAPVWRVVLAEEVDDSGRTEPEVLERLKDRLQTMREAVERGIGLLRGHCAVHGEITAAAFRDLIGASRKYSIAFLDYCDRTGVTLRVGDVRRMR